MSIILWIIGLWQAWRQRRLDKADRQADIAIDNAWSKPIFPWRLPPGTVEQELLKEFIALEKEVNARKDAKHLTTGSGALLQDLLRQQQMAHQMQNTTPEQRAAVFGQAIGNFFNQRIR